MTDIIARAQELADNGHQPGPWKASSYDELGERGDSSWGITSHDGDYIGIMHGSNSTLAAFAPDAVAALAEETRQWGVQAREYDPIEGWLEWGMCIPFYKDRTRESCVKFIKARKSKTFQYRLVCQRVSPIEVITHD